MYGFNFLKATGPLRGDNLLFIRMSQIPNTHLTNHRRLRGPWSHPVVSNLESLNLEFHLLTSRSFILK